MADRRKKKKKEVDVSPEDEKPAKVEYEIAKYLRNKLPDKKTFLLGHKVDYFIASKAIDCLLDSKWAVKDKNQTEPMFTTRESVEQFMETMLIHKFFHRAKKIIVSKDSSKKKQHTGDECCSGHSHSAVTGDEQVKEKKKESKKQKEKVKTTEKESKEKDKDNEKDKEKSKNEKESTEKDSEKKKEKKKIKLDMHLEQVFIDANEPYVWIYDPVPLKAWFIGFGLVFGAVAICLFPLWPKTVRNYVYYLSVAAAVFLFFIISLAVIRLVVFAIVVVLTFGRHHIWLLPNLTEDVGFFESFWPLYEYKYKGKDNKDDSEKNDEVEEKNSEKEKKDDKQDKDENDDVEVKEKDDSDNSEASDNGSQPNSRGSQSTGTSNGFEILDEEEVQDNEAKKDK